ncbi:hypothetical protein NP493_257g02037 [Ridgeia piscesae]|uniref:Uncharacterized protein n=1 Tax=Ridgeia piscesae TaxID=27915 RepID=A0AAD9NY95_RIDPI|nr:hypothetical protein NP493_257g02037 [Ridgeia piscesae]
MFVSCQFAVASANGRLAWLVKWQLNCLRIVTMMNNNYDTEIYLSANIRIRQLCMNRSSLEPQ